MNERGEAFTEMPTSEHTEQDVERNNELPEDLPEEVKKIVTRGGDKRYITAVEVLERDSDGRITQVQVRKEDIYVSMVGMSGGVGSSDNRYNATETYTLEYDGDTLHKVIREATWDGNRPELAVSEMNDEPRKEFEF